MNIIKYPLATEKSVRLIDSENKLIFVVEKSATRQQVKEALESMLKVKVLSVNTSNMPTGEKRAYVTFSPETPAIDVATKLGLM